MIKDMSVEEKLKLDNTLQRLFNEGFNMEGVAKNALLMLGRKSTWDEAQQYVYNLVEHLKSEGLTNKRLNRSGRKQIFGADQSISMETLHAEYLKRHKAIWAEC